MPTVGGDEYVDPAQSTPKGRFVPRADAIRPYGFGWENATIQRTALSQKRAGRLLVDPCRAVYNTQRYMLYIRREMKIGKQSSPLCLTT